MKNCKTIYVRKSDEVGTVTSFLVVNQNYDPLNPQDGIVFPTNPSINDNTVTIFDDGILYSTFDGTTWVDDIFVPNCCLIESVSTSSTITLDVDDNGNLTADLTVCAAAGPYDSHRAASEDDTLDACKPYFLAKINENWEPVSGSEIGPIFFKKELI